MASDGPRIEAIGQIAVAVADVDRAAAFYEQVLGLRLLFRFPGLAFFDCGGVRLMLSRPEASTPAATSIIYYRVAEIGASARVLEERGARVLHAPRVIHRDDRHELWMAFFEDSEGNTLALMQEAALGAAGGD